MAVYRFTYIGAIAGVENFAFGFHVVSPAASAADAVPIAQTWFNTFFSTVNVGITWEAGIVFQQVSVAAVNTSGVSDTALGSITGAGSGTGNPTPFQTSLVVSLITTQGATPPGPARGRFYLPTPRAGALGGDGLFSTVTTTAIADGVEAATEELSVPAQQNMVVARVTRDAQGNITSVNAEPVTTIQVGNVPDTQRRRRNKLVEVYTTREIAIP